jgi:hypothetical protein
MIVPKVKSLISLGCPDIAIKAIALANVIPSYGNARKEIPPSILLSKMTGESDVAVQTELPVPAQIETQVPVQIQAHVISFGGDCNANKAVVVYSSDDSTVRKASPPPTLSSKVAGKRLQVPIQAPVPFPSTAPVPVAIEAPVPVAIEAPVPVQIEAGNNVAVKRKKKRRLDNGDARCLHNTRRTICKHCKGNSLCEHLKQKQWCAICRPGTSGARCVHGKHRADVWNVAGQESVNT